MADQDDGQERDEGDLFGGRVRMARAWANMSQQELADKLKALDSARGAPTSLMSIKRIEAGDSAEGSRDAFAAAVAEATGVPVWFILQGWGEEPEGVDDLASLARTATAHARRIRGIETTIDLLAADFSRTSSATRTLGNEIEKLHARTYEEDSRLAADIGKLAAEVRAVKGSPNAAPEVNAARTLRQGAADAARLQAARPARKPAEKQRKQG